MSKKKDPPKHALPLTEDVLIVEDSRIVQGIMRKTLASLTGRKIVQANNGIDALKVVQQADYRFGIIFVDFAMPKMSGIEFVRQVRALPDERAKTAIVAVTGNQKNLSQTQMRTSGLNGAVIKPINFQNIFAVLQLLPLSSADRWLGVFF